MTLLFSQAKICDLASLENDSEKMRKNLKNKQVAKAKFLIFEDICSLYMMSGT